MQPDEILQAYTGAFVDELALAGVRHVCVSPGSRSTPLATMFEQHPHIRLWMHLDERSCAYFGLGLAKALREPVAILCTSGTAAANFLPAIVEARYGRVPLIVLTADRPPELRDVGAAQTIDQLHLYGGNVKWFAEMALPEASAEAIRYVRGAADRAVATCRSTPRGPVHLNFPFREPLLPTPLQHGDSSGRPVLRRFEGISIPPAETVAALAAPLAEIERGVIVCGPLDDRDFPVAVRTLAQRLGYPILADPLSQTRCGGPTSHVIASYDAFLRDEHSDDLAPEIVLRFGALPTSKPLTQFLQRHQCRHILVDEAGWNDAMMVTTDMVAADGAALCGALASAVEGDRQTGWLARWQETEGITRRSMAAYLDRVEEPFEGKVFAELADVLPEGATLFAGSSMPVRDLDTFFPASGKRVRFMANRGANGIDGVVSSALGASAAGGPLVLVIGDLSFYHDMNGLLAAKLHALDATIVVLNNDGGGIFSFLPQAGAPGFETLFGTPHGLSFAPTAALYGAEYERVTAWGDFREAMAEALAHRGLSIVEMPTDRERNVTLHRDLWKEVSAALGEMRSALV